MQRHHESRETRARGRPPTFTPGQRQLVAELVRDHGVRGARRICPFAISQATVLSIAREFGVPLKKGRRPKAA